MSLSSVAYSILDLAPVRDTGNYAGAFAAAVQAAEAADQLGYTRFWLAEHHNMDGIGSSATAVLIGHLAAATRRIRVGSGGIMLPNHVPLMVAETFGTLACLYPGRIDLGVGRAPGTDGATVRALKRDPLSGAEDFPEQLAELQYFLGECQPGQQVMAVPGQGSDVPIWLLGSSLFSAALAARRGLPFAFASHFAPRLLMEALHTYRTGFVPSGVLDKPYAAIGVPVCVAATDREAQRLFTTAQQSIVALLRGESLRQRPPVNDMESLWNPVERRHVMDFHQLAAVGSVARVRDTLAAIAAETGADEFIFTSSIYEPEARLNSLALTAEIMRG